MKRDNVVIYQDTNREWRWHRTNYWNSQITAQSSEGYRRRIDCERMAKKINRRARFRIKA